MSNNNDLNAILALQSSSKKEDQKFTSSELLKKYFVPRVPDGQSEAIFKVRIIPNPASVGGQPFNIVKFHSIKYGGGYPKFLCLEEIGQECPFCETHGGLMDEGKKTDALPYRAQDHYIVKVLDRANEGDGTKFWRFKRNFKGQGEFDKIASLIKNGFDIIATDKEGYDLVINCGLNDKKKSVVTSILCVKPSPLADSEEKIQEIINQDVVWQDVFKPKTAEYLEDIIAGRAQYWDKKLNKYVTPGKESDETTTENKVELISNSSVETSPKIEDNPLMKDEKINETAILSSDDDDDLPF